MDYDSSTKFISSLAKFLQSLCNGYVEFDSGVQVIGHLYLSVDTGKTIDYILNEKVCKTDENSVTFISNSFHAQPAEKPKPPGKKTPKEADKVESKLEDSDSYNGAPTELSSTNVGTVPSRNISSPHAVKRPLSPSLKQSKVKSGRSSPKHKKSRNEQADHNAPSQHSNQANENSVSSVPSPSDSIPLHSEPVAGVDNESYPHGFFNPDEEHSLVSDSDERDIKPNIDTDVTFIKEEFAANSGSSQSHDRSHDDPSGYSYQSNPVFPGGYLGASGFGTSPRSNYAASSSSQMYSSNSGPHSKEEGPGDSSDLPSRQSERSQVLSKRAAVVRKQGDHVFSEEDSQNEEVMYAPATPFTDWSSGDSQSVNQFGVFECNKCGKVYSYRRCLQRHQWKCNQMRSFQCNLCNKEFYRSDKLRAHMRHLHSVELPRRPPGTPAIYSGPASSINGHQE